MGGWAKADKGLWTVSANWGLISQPIWQKQLNKALFGWLLKHSRVSGCSGEHGPLHSRLGSQLLWELFGWVRLGWRFEEGPRLMTISLEADRTAGWKNSSKGNGLCYCSMARPLIMVSCWSGCSQAFKPLTWVTHIPKKWRILGCQSMKSDIMWHPCWKG